MIAASASPTPARPATDERQARQPQRRGAEDRVDHQGAGEDAKPTQAVDQPPANGASTPIIGAAR